MTIEDPLMHLPVSAIAEVPKGHVFNAGSIYVVIEGLVKIGVPKTGGGSVLLDVATKDDFFGLGALVVNDGSETATALTNARVMSWTAPELMDIVLKRPDLGLALLQLAIQCSVDRAARILSLASYGIEGRLATALLRFAERFGTPGENGAVEMFPFTHELLAEYLGTSREIVSHFMNYFRRRGRIAYNRHQITVYPAVFAAAAEKAAA